MEFTRKTTSNNYEMKSHNDGKLRSASLDMGYVYKVNVVVDVQCLRRCKMFERFEFADLKHFPILILLFFDFIFLFHLQCIYSFGVDNGGIWKFFRYVFCHIHTLNVWVNPFFFMFTALNAAIYLNQQQNTHQCTT